MSPSSSVEEGKGRKKFNFHSTRSTGKQSEKYCCERNRKIGLNGNKNPHSDLIPERENNFFLFLFFFCKLK